MPGEQGLNLDRNGTFNASGPGGTFSLHCDTVEDRERWVVASRGDTGLPRRLSRHFSLDSALDHLAMASGVGQDYTVTLPCQGRFRRPGRIPSEQVLAGFEYVVAKGIRAYAIIETEADSTTEEVRRLLVRRLHGRAAAVGDVDLVERVEDRSVWCCDITVPFEGLVRRTDAEGMALEEIEGTDIEVTGCFEVIPSGPVSYRKANVIEFSPSFVRAA